MSTAATPETSVSTWNIDPVHSHAQFKVKHMMISNVKGEFTSITGKLELNEADITKSRVQASIDTKTINTREPQRDAHLKSADFLDVEKHPTLAFTSTRIIRTGENEFEVAGDLTIHGITRKATFMVEELSAPIKDPWGATRLGLSASTRINRKDFGLLWNSPLETGGVLVGDEVTITVDAEFVKA
ncbi:MAG TPA: YceI family protein [Candidatus Aquilonibacter sp.]|nr:YceI family protein [Candidatus Aquilonibacter sp.]